MYMIYIITDYILLFSDQLYIYYYYYFIIYYTSYMCIHTYSHKDTYIYTYIYLHIYVICIHTSLPLTETPRSLDFQRSLDGEYTSPESKMEA